MKVKCSAQEHNTMSLARARSRTARCGDEMEVERTSIYHNTVFEHGKGKVCIRAKWPIRPELISVSLA